MIKGSNYFYCILYINDKGFIDDGVYEYQQRRRRIMSSSNYDLNDSPNHFMVLDAITKGVDSIDKIGKATKLPKDEVELIVNDLLTQRLIVKVEKKGFIFLKKKVNLGVTEVGIKLLNAKKQELEEKRQQMQQSFENGNGTQLQGYMDANRSWIPLMLFSGIMDIMFFTSMMSFMGLGMNPVESSLVSNDGSVQDTGGNTGEAHHVNDQSGTAGNDDTSSIDSNADGSAATDSDGFASSGIDSGGFDGFDGGGFDSF